MKKYIEFLETTKVYRLSNTIGGFTFNKDRDYIKVDFVLECRPEHLQPLIDMGVKFDFSNKRVGLAYNQVNIGGTANSLSIKAQCSLKTFKHILDFFRGEFRPNMKNNTQLEWEGFIFSKRLLKRKV